MPSSKIEILPVREALLPQVSSSGSEGVPWPPDEEPADGSDRVGTQIGPYRLLVRIGHGGMGIVYKAEQLEPLKRHVALKLIRHGMETGEVLARFNLERQSLAMLDHPGIARVFDAGSSESGRPYFAMEFVPGEPITLFCDGHHLTIRERLELLIGICDAVQHAHFKGIIHRDLKPGNLLVAEPTAPETRLLAKVIDFGIAKAVGGGASETDDALPLTTNLSVIGTPEYMSPEQLSGGDVDTRADVYSLGVILYELLTGALPFDRRQRRPAIPGTSQQAVTQDAIRPSKRFAQLDAKARASAAGVRGIEPGGLQRMLKGDLDWIVLKAMEEKRKDRYATPTELAQDIKFFLAEKPLNARPATGTYLARKFIRRHKFGVIATAAIAVTLVMGIIGTGIGYIHARAAEDIANVQRRDAQRALSELYPVSGLNAAGRGDWSEAALWFAHSAQLAETAQNDGGLVALNRIRAQSADRNAIQPVSAFALRDARPNAISFDPSAKYLLVQANRTAENKRAMPGETSESCTIWNLQTQKPFQLPAGVSGIRAAAWSPDGSHIAVATGESSAMRIFRFPQFGQAVELKGIGEIDDLKFDPTGRLLVARGGRHAGVWNTSTGDAVLTTFEHPKEITEAIFSTGSASLITACSDDKARVFKLDEKPAADAAKGETSDPIVTTPHLGSLTAATVAPIAPFTLSGGIFVVLETNGLVVRRLSTGDPIYALKVDSAIQWVTSNADADRIAAGIAGQVMTAHRNPDGKFEWDAWASPRPSGSVSGKFSPDGRWLLTTSSDGHVEVFPVEGRADRTAKTPFHAHAVLATAWSADGSMFATAQVGGLVRAWAMSEPSPLRLATIPIHGSRSAVRFSHDGQLILPSGEVSIEARELHADLYATRVYSLNGTPVGPTLDPNGVIIAAQFASDDSCVVAAVRGEGSNRLHIWDWKTGLDIAKPLMLPSDPRALAVRPGTHGSEVAVLCAGGEVILVDLHGTSDPLQFKVSPTGRPRGIATGRIIYSPDGNLVATWGENENLDVCDSQGKSMFHIPHRGGPRDARFSADGSQLVSLAGDGSVRLTDTRTGTRITELPVGSWSAGSPNSSTSLVFPTAQVRFSPDAQSCMVVSDTLVHLFGRLGDSSTKRVLAHPQPVTAAEFSPDGRWILTATKDGEIRVWERSSGHVEVMTRTPSVAVPAFIDISANGRRALIGGQSREAEILDLDAVALSSSAIKVDTDKLRRTAELVSGRQMEAGSLLPLSDEQWLSRWNESRLSDATMSGRWHRQQAATCIDAGDAVAAQMHLHAIAGTAATPDDGARDRDRIAFAHALAGNINAAEARYATLVTQRPDDRELNLDYGDMLLALGRADGAVAAYRKAMSVAGPQAESNKSDDWVRGNWWVSRSYPPGLDLVFPPESFIGSTKDGAAPQVDTTLWTFTGLKGPSVDFNALLQVTRDRKGGMKTAYAQTFIYAREKRKLGLSIGTDDLGRLWFNGVEIYSYAAEPRGAVRGQGRVVVELQTGWNTLLAKVVDLGRAEHELIATVSSRDDDVALAKAQIFGDRADAAAARGDFKQAMKDVEEAINLAPQDSQRWQERSTLLLNAGNLKDWRTLCTDVVARFGDSSDRSVAERVAKICSSADESGIEPSVLVGAAERALDGGPDQFLEWFQLARGMVAYRIKDYSTAAEWLSRSRGTAKTSGSCRTLATLYLAMTEYQQKNTVEAGQLLKEGADSLDKLESEPLKRLPDWNDRLAARIVRAEASALISKAQQTPQH